MTDVSVMGSFLNAAEPLSPVAVLLPPLAADRHFWDGVAAAASDIACYGVDLPGHGQAAVPGGPYSVDDVAEALLAHLEAVGITEFHLVGLSFGGVVTQRLAATAPGRVRSALVADAVSTYPLDWQQTWRERAAGARANGAGTVAPASLGMWLTPAAIAARGAAHDYAVATLGSVDDEGYALACDFLADVDVTGSLADIGIPTTVVCGTNDVPLFRNGAESIAAAITTSELMWLEGAKHASALEFPVEFTAILRDLITREAASA